MRRGVMVGVAVAAAVAAVGAAVAVGSSSGGGGTSAAQSTNRSPTSAPPTSVAPVTTSGGGSPTEAGPAHVPHNDVAAVYNLFGGDPEDVRLLGIISKRLESEGYHVLSYQDANEGAGGHGGATLANFVGMARRASVIVIIAHGEDYAFAGQSKSCQLLAKKFFPQCESETPSRGIIPVPRAPTTIQFPVPWLQVEWYPTWKAEQHALQRYVSQGYRRDWLFDPYGLLTHEPPNLNTLLAWRPGDAPSVGKDGKYDLSTGARPWLGITQAGVAHFFGGRKIDLVDNLACKSLAFASSFDARSYLGHRLSACPLFQYFDQPTLWGRLIGREGVPARSTTGAFGLGGFLDANFQLSAGSQPVVLSPAVESVDPPDGARVAVGKTTTVSIQFDAVMKASAAAGLVDVSGCGATTSNPRWSGNDVLKLDVTVPKKPPNTTMNLLLHSDKAVGPGVGDNQQLDGNTNPTDASGVAPNGDDYKWTLSCRDSPIQSAPPSTTPPGQCNPGDVELLVHVHGHMDVDMTYTDNTSPAQQTSWPPGNAPFPNLFPKYPAPYLRYGCFHLGTKVHLGFRNADEPWTHLWKTTGNNCDHSKGFTKGASYSPAALAATIDCDLVMNNNRVVNAYWIEPTFTGSTLTDFAPYPDCLPDTQAHYCPPGS